MSSASWWAAKLGGSQAPRQSVPPTQPAPQPAPPQAPVRSEERCPQCGSVNYFTKSQRPRCFDCAYSPSTRDIGNSTQGISTVAKGEVRPALQVETSYTPNQIVGRVE